MPALASAEYGPMTSSSSTPSNRRTSMFICSGCSRQACASSGGNAIVTEDPAMPQSVSVLVLHAVVPLDLGIAAQVLSYPEAPYDVSLLRCSRREGTHHGGLCCPHGPRALGLERGRHGGRAGLCTAQPGPRAICGCVRYGPLIYGARGWSRFVRARSLLRRLGHLTAAGRQPTGCTQTNWLVPIRQSK
jgi:hypothetical protein